MHMLGEQAFFEPLTGMMRASVAKDLLDSAISFDANNTDHVSWIWLGSDTANHAENVQASAAAFVVLPIIGQTAARTIQQLLRGIDTAREHGKPVVPIVHGITRRVRRFLGRGRLFAKRDTSAGRVL